LTCYYSRIPEEEEDTLLQPAPDLIVDWIEVWTVRRPLQWRDEIRHFTAQHLNSFTDTVAGALSCWNVKKSSDTLRMAMLETAIFDHLFIKSNISAVDRLVVVKFHTSIANRWLFNIQGKIMAIILYS